MTDKYTEGPLISVIIPFYSSSKDGLRDIRVAINGVLRQTYKRYEIIVVDDGSPEKADDILQDFHDKVKIITQKNQGTIAARTTGVANMRGEFIAFLDHDDWWDRDKLECQIRIMQQNRDLGLVFGDLRAVDKRGKKLGFTVIDKSMQHDPTWEELICIYPLYPSSTLMRADLFNKVRFDMQFGLAGSYGDQDFHARLREITKFHYMNRCVGYYYWINDRKMADNMLANFGYFALKQWRHPNLSGKDGTQIREHFALKVRSELAVLFRRLLNEHGTIADKAMLKRYIDYEKALNSQLGPDFVEITKCKILDASLFEQDDFTCTCLFVFLSRVDYQQAFPEVYQGDLSRYLDWISDIRNGRHIDSDRGIFDKAINGTNLADSSKAVNVVKCKAEEFARLPYHIRLLQKCRNYIGNRGFLEFIRIAFTRLIKLDFRV